MSMKKGEVIEGIVEYVEFPNKGIIKIEDKKIIVKNVIKGQKIKCSIHKIRKGKIEGRLLEILEKSNLEDREASCPRFGECGGCNYQTISYQNQIKIKEEQVKRLLDGVCKQYEFEGILESPIEWEYRNKMEFSFGDERKDGPLALGLHKRGSFYDIVTADQCKIVDKDYNLVLKCVLDYFTELKIPFYKKLTHEGYLRHLLVRRATKTSEMVVSLITSSQKQVPLQAFVNRLLELPLTGTIVGILHITNDSLADIVQSDKTEILYGTDFFYEELLGLKFKISTFSFFQTNSLGAEVLYSKVREYIGDTKDKVIFDLYSGTGTIAQILAPVAKKVIGVEIVEEAVLAARENAKFNHLDNCNFIAGDVLKVMDTIEEKPDIIVLDPPREGIHPKALQKIIDYGVANLVYISCKPTSLVRDLVVLQEQGYEVKKVCCCDLFPETVHVETCVLLSRRNGGNISTRIEIEMDLTEADKRECIGIATYPQIKDYIMEKHGIKMHTSFIAQIKKKYGLDMRENYNKSKKENPEVRLCSKEKEEMIVEALTHFGMLR